jgi:DNA-binding SARP family transcriptional activator/tetratricopeptide (TPR) repeat protein
MAPSSGLVIHLLGTPRCLIDGAALAGIKGGKMLGLLAYLIAERNQAHRRDALADLFWPDHTLEQARAHLRHLLHHLTRSLTGAGADSLLQLTRQTVACDAHSAAWIDLLAFEDPSPTEEHGSAALQRCEQRLDLYRGPFLAGLALDGEEISLWLEARRERCRKRALALADRLVEGWQAEGDLQRALAIAQRRVTLEPLDEAGCRNLMRQYARLGDAGGVVNAFDELATTLRQEVASEPGEETAALRAALLAALAPTDAMKGIGRAGGAELRPATVLCCGYVPLGADIDADTSSRQLEACRAQGIETIRAHGGHALSVPGRPWLLAFFGFPVAREEAGRMAGHCAIALRDQAAAMAGVGLRLGMHAGRMLNDGSGADPDMDGSLSSVARRLQVAAGVGECLLSADCLAALQGWFLTAPVHPQAIVGLERPVLRLVAATGARRSRPSDHPPAPWCGREESLAALAGHWQGIRDGRGQVVLVSGDVGMGKSRLAEEMRQRVLGEDAVVVELHCAPERSNSPFDPFLTLLAQQAGLDAEAPPSARAGQVEQWLQRSCPGLPGDLRLALAERFTEPVTAGGAAAAAARARLFEAADGLLTAWAGRAPLWLLVDDLQWADPSTREWLQQLTAKVAERPWMVLLLGRTEGTSADARWHSLRLGPLAPDDTRALVTALVDACGTREGLSSESIERIAALSEGSPFYAEALSRLGMDLSTDVGGAVVTIPPRLRDALAARIDRLGKARRLAQLGAVLGQGVRLRWLVALAGLPATHIANDQQRLLAQGVWLETEGEPGVVRVRHALLHEALYQSLPAHERRNLHLRAAEAFATACPDLADSHPELAAHHWREGGALVAAANSWLAAGRRAAQRGAFHEALAHFSEGLTDIEAVDDDEARRSVELSLLLGLCGPLTIVEGYWSTSLQDYLTRAQSLARGMEARRDVFNLLWGQWVVSLFHGRLRESVRIVERLDAIAREGSEPALAAGAAYARCDTLLSMGRFAASLSSARETLACLKSLDRAAQYAQFGFALGALAQAKRLNALFYLGENEALDSELAVALAEAAAEGDAHDQVCLMVAACQIHFFHARHEESLRHAEQAMVFTSQEQLAHWRLILELFRYAALAAAGDRAAVVELRTVAETGSAMIPAKAATFHQLLGTTLQRTGRYAEARGVLRHNLTLIRRTDEACHAADTWHLLGECERALHGDTTRTRFYLGQALRVSQRQQCRAIEARVRASLAALSAA